MVKASILKSPQKPSDGEARPRLILVSSTLPPKRVQNITIEKVLRASGTDTAAHEEARRNNDLLAGDRQAGQGRLGPSPRHTRVALTIAQESAILDFTEAATSGNMPKGRRRPGAHIARPKGVDILNTRATLPSHLP